MLAPVVLLAAALCASIGFIGTADAGAASPAAPLTVTTTSLPAVQSCASLFPCTGYSAPLNASGGTPGYSWSVVGGALPPGLSLQTNGVVVGYPIFTLPGAYPATFQVTDSVGATAQVGLSLQVTAPSTPSGPPLTIATTSLPVVQPCASLYPCTDYSAALSASGGTPGYTWSVVGGALPSGLSLQSNGVIVGYPIATPIGTYPATFQVTDAVGATAQAVLSLQVAVPDNDLALTGVPAPITVAGTSSSGVPVTFTPPTAVDEDTATVPVVCDHASGSVFPIGTTKVTCTATDPDDTNSPVSASFTVTVTDSDLALTGVPTPITAAGTSVSGANVTFTPPRSVDEDAATVPVVCDHASGSVFPIGTTKVTCTATDPDDTNSPVSASFTVTVTNPFGSLTIVTTSLPSVKTCASLFPCTSYSAPLNASGGTPGYTWSVVGGALPLGLSLQSNGVIVGYPIHTPTGTYTATFQVTDSKGATAQAALSILVTP